MKVKRSQDDKIAPVVNVGDIIYTSITLIPKELIVVIWSVGPFDLIYNSLLTYESSEDLARATVIYELRMFKSKYRKLIK